MLKAELEKLKSDLMVMLNVVIYGWQLRKYVINKEDEKVCRDTYPNRSNHKWHIRMACGHIRHYLKVSVWRIKTLVEK